MVGVWLPDLEDHELVDGIGLDVEAGEARPPAAFGRVPGIDVVTLVDVERPAEVGADRDGEQPLLEAELHGQFEDGLWLAVASPEPSQPALLFGDEEASVVPSDCIRRSGERHDLAAQHADLRDLEVDADIGQPRLGGRCGIGLRVGLLLVRCWIGGFRVRGRLGLGLVVAIGLRLLAGRAGLIWLGLLDGLRLRCGRCWRRGRRLIGIAGAGDREQREEEEAGE